MQKFSVGLCASGVAEFFKMGGQIMAKNGFSTILLVY
jgi:hypothetical protein